MAEWTMRRRVGDGCSLARQGRELPCRCRLGAGQVQEHVQMRLDGQGQGPSRVAGCCWFAKVCEPPPAAGRNVKINWQNLPQA